jgi:hypothetical protein
MERIEANRARKWLNIDRADVVFGLMMLAYISGIVTAAVADRIHWGVPFPH